MPWMCDVEARSTNGKRSGRERTVRVDKRYLKRAWSQLYLRPWPDGMFACHMCDEPRCSNPHHIFPGTASDNSKDAFLKGRVRGAIHRAGEQHRFAKLTWERIENARERYLSGESQRSIARDFGVNQSQISRVLNGLRWKEAQGAVDHQKAG